MRQALLPTHETPIVLVDPRYYCYGLFGRPTQVECSLSGDCWGHETGAQSAVHVGDAVWGEIRHYAKNPKAAGRWAQRYRRRHGGVILREEEAET